METEKTTTVGHFQEIAGRKFLIKNKDISSGSKSKYLPISIGYDQANTIKTILLDREEDLVVINDKKIDNILSPGDILWDLEKIEEKFSMPSDGATRIRFELTLKTFSGSQTKETIDFWIDDKAPTIIKHDQDKVQLYEFNDRKEGSGVKSVTFHYLDDKGNAQQSTLENKGNENPWMIDINRESDIKITTVSAIDHSGNENISSFLN
jgi:hypothetical protein